MSADVRCSSYKSTMFSMLSKCSSVSPCLLPQHPWAAAWVHSSWNPDLHKKPLMLPRNPFRIAFNLHCRLQQGSTGKSSRQGKQSAREINLVLTVKRINRDSGSIAPGVCKYWILPKTNSEGNRVVKPFINSSCPMCVTGKWCPRGKQHWAFELALNSFGSSHFKGLKYNNMFWGSLPCSLPGEVVKPVALKLLLSLHRIFAVWQHG